MVFNNLSNMLLEYNMANHQRDSHQRLKFLRYNCELIQCRSQLLGKVYLAGLQYMYVDRTALCLSLQHLISKGSIIYLLNTK